MGFDVEGGYLLQFQEEKTACEESGQGCNLVHVLAANQQFPIIRAWLTTLELDNVLVQGLFKAGPATESASLDSASEHCEEDRRDEHVEDKLHFEYTGKQIQHANKRNVQKYAQDGVSCSAEMFSDQCDRQDKENDPLRYPHDGYQCC